MRTLDLPRVNKKILSAAVASALCTMAPATYAVTINAAVDYSLGSGTTINVIDGPASTGSVDVSQYVSDVDGNNIFAHTYGNTMGNFGSRVSGEGTYDINGLFTYSDTITNTSGGDLSYDFDFTVIPGELSVFGAPAAGESLYAGYDIEIRLDGVVIWDSSADLNRNDTNTTFADTGTYSLGGTYNGTDRYSWGTFNGLVDLGTFGDGDSFQLEYDLLASANGSMSATGCGFDGGEGVFLAVDGGEGGGGGACGGSTARSGDPLYPIGTPTFGVTAHSVPEPATFLLLGGGLAGIALARKKQAKKS